MDDVTKIAHREGGGGGIPEKCVRPLYMAPYSKTILKAK